MNISYKKGDLFYYLENLLQNTRSNIYIPHVTNNHNSFYVGFVEALNKRWPSSLKEKSPQWVFFNKERKLGNVDIINPEDRTYVLNMCAQDNINQPLNGCRLSYSSLMKCMQDVSQIIVQPGIILTPKFGAGIAGGNWTTINKLIHELWHEHTVIVVEY